MIGIHPGMSRSCLTIIIFSSAVVEHHEEINLAIGKDIAAEVIVNASTTIVIESHGSKGKYLQTSHSQVIYDTLSLKVHSYTQLLWLDLRVDHTLLAKEVCWRWL